MVKGKVLLPSKSAKKPFFQKFLFILRQNRQEKGNPKFYNCIGSSLRLGSLLTASGAVGGAYPSRGSTLVELEKKHAVSKKIE